MAKVAQDRRIDKRVPIELDVRVESTKSVFESTSTDLSPSGMFVVTPRNIATLPEPGSHVMLTFGVRDGGMRVELAVVGIVKWKRQQHDVPGLGISFFRIDPEVRAVLDRFCSVRAPLYGDAPLGTDRVNDDDED